MKNLILLTLYFLLFGETHSQTNPQFIRHGDILERGISCNESHLFTLDTDTGKFISIFIKEKGVMLDAVLKKPDGSEAKRFTASSWFNGLLYLEYVTDTNGVYSLDVKTKDSIGTGSYVLNYLVCIPEKDQKLKDKGFDSKIFEDYYLNFEPEPGRVISMGPAHEFGAGGKLMYLDTKTNRFGILYPLSDSTFYSPYAFIDTYSDNVKITFHRVKEKLNGLTWVEGDKTFKNCPVVFPGTVEKISFTNDTVTLKGILITPEGKGPFPAVVFAHGSGASQRDQFFFLSYFLRFGIAVLSFDKRGAGESTGDWLKSSFNNLSQDILNGIEFLKKNEKIDSSNIGLFGISQGGWVGALCASRSSSVKFLIINTGPGGSVNENMAYEYECIIREKENYTDAEVPEIKLFYYSLLQKATNGVPYDSIQQFISLYKDKKGVPDVPMVKLPRDARWWTWQKLNGNFDNAEILKKVHCPVLWMLGDLDKNVPSFISEKKIKTALELAGNKNYTVKVFSPAAHVLMESQTGYFSDGAIQQSRFIEGYWKTKEEWINKNVLKK